MSAAQHSHAHAHAHDVPCPDPSVHEKSNKLSEQASSAALYVTHPERAAEARVYQENPLGPDGKLSSKSAAASLKYAKPQDLPSFPSNGLSADSAGKAAMLAKDYKMKDLWQPEQSLAGSKAAILAQAKGGKLDLWQASSSSAGHSAATLAMRNKALSPVAYTGVDADNRSKALQAATMSASKGRSRAESTPAPPPPLYPDAQNSSHNALNAATVSHRTSTIKTGTADGWDSDAMQAARIKNSHMERELFSAAPPVDIERDEARHQAALRASAVSMAKQIYDSQDRNVMVADPADVAGAQAAAGRSSTSSAGPTDLKQEAMRYISLQETAHKLAAERLAKVDKNLEDSRYREYYGYGDKPKRLSQRMSMRSVGGRQQRKRASSDVSSSRYDEDSDDEEQARRIRSQMSQLNTGLTQIDQKKQQDDRARLMAAAEKKVQQRMHNMDEKVFADTGKVPPALMEEWEAKARERAQKERELQAQNPGKTHIGGGKFMDQSEIEAIAAARLKPTLDDINDTAQKKRERDEELRLEKEEQERQKREERATKKEEKDEQKRVKSEEKAVAKQHKDEEKARQAEEKRVAKEEKRKSRNIKREEAKDVAAAGAGGATLAEVAEKVKEDNEPEHEATAAEGVQRHRSAISRLKDRFRRSHDESNEEHEKKPHTGAAAVGGAATGATLAGVGDEPLDSQQAAHAVAADDAEKSAVVSPVSSVAAHEPVAESNVSAPVAASSKAVEPVATTDDKWKPVVAPTTATAAAAAPAILIAEEDDDDDDVDFPGSKTRPVFEQKPSLSGFHNDEIPQAKPDLERHISHIPESDDDDDYDDGDDEDWNDERVGKPGLGAGNAHAVADRVVTAPVTSTPETAAPVTTTTTTTSSALPAADQSAEGPIPDDEATNRTLARLDDQRAEPKDLPETFQSPGVPKASPAIGSGITANDSRTEDDADTKLQTEPGHKEHSILRQIINPGGDKYDNEAFGETAKEVPAEELRDEKPAHGEHTILRQIVNPGGDKYDPKAFPAPKESTEEKTATAAAAAPTTATTTSAPSQKTEHAKLTKSPAAAESEKERKGGLRGLLNKFGSRKSKDDNKYPDFKPVSKSDSVPYEEHKAAQKPVTGTTAAAAKASQEPKTEASTTGVSTTILPPVETGPKFGEDHVHSTTTQTAGTATTTDDKGKAAVATEPDSPSSFHRNEVDRPDPDDVSSSGADEDDVQRGRGRGGGAGRSSTLARKLGFGGSRTYRNERAQPGKLTSLQPTSAGAGAADRQGSGSATDEHEHERENFEEARDHFDEGLAPPPAFAGQAKSESPVRETRFQEQL